MLIPWKKSYDQPRQHIRKQRYYIANKGPSSQGYGFSSGHVWMWELDYKESWVLKNWCFWTVMLEKTLKSPLDCKEIQPVHPKGDQSWVFIGRTDVETPILWPPDVKSWLIWKDPDAGRDWGQEEKGTTEDEMVGWHHQFDGHEFDYTPELAVNREAWRAAVNRVAESDTTGWLDWSEFAYQLMSPMAMHGPVTLLSELWTNQVFHLRCYMRCHLTLVRMTIIKMSKNDKCWRGFAEKATLLHCWWGYKLVQALWRTVWNFLKG